MLDTVQHLSFVDAIHLLQEIYFIVCHLLEFLDLLGPDHLLEGEEVEIKGVRKVETEFAGLLDCFGEVVMIEFVVKD